MNGFGCPVSYHGGFVMGKPYSCRTIQLVAISFSIVYSSTVSGLPSLFLAFPVTWSWKELCRMPCSNAAPRTLSLAFTSAFAALNCLFVQALLSISKFKFSVILCYYLVTVNLFPNQFVVFIVKWCKKSNEQ